MKRKTEVWEYMCDGCGDIVIAATDAMPQGIVGTVIETADGVATNAEFFACKRTCVGMAVDSALDVAWSK
jgi:uncharacterized cysteine cluster protein YcgN (CxxCxxCC family)